MTLSQPGDPAKNVDPPTLVSAMLTKLQTADVSVVSKPWGAEFIVNAGDFILKAIRVNPDAATSLQYHRVKDEVVVILDGEGHLEYEGAEMGHEREVGRPSPPYRVVPGAVHRAVGPLTLLEVTSPHNDDVVRLVDNYGRAGDDQNGSEEEEYRREPPGYSAGPAEHGYEGDG